MHSTMNREQTSSVILFSHRKRRFIFLDVVNTTARSRNWWRNWSLELIAWQWFNAEDRNHCWIMQRNENGFEKKEKTQFWWRKYFKTSIYVRKFLVFDCWTPITCGLWRLKKEKLKHNFEKGSEQKLIFLNFFHRKI